MKKGTSTFSLTAAIVTVVVGVLALGAWFAYIALTTYLSTPHTYGDVEVIPYGHNIKGLLTHSWDSVTVKQGGNTYTVRNFSLDVSILSEKKGATVKLGELDVQVNTNTPSSKPQNGSSKGPKEALEFPDKVKFYLPVEISAGKISVDVDKDTPQQMHWQAENFKFKSEGMQQASIKLDSIQGDYISETASIDIKADFEGDNVKVKGKLAAGNDAIDLDVSLPKDNLTAVSTNIDMEVKDPKKWIPVKLPPELPTIGAVKVKGTVKLDPKTQMPQYNLNLKTRIGEFWPLMACNAIINLKGNDERFHFETDLNNDEGGHIHLEGDADKNLDGDLTGYVEYMSSEFGPQMMPLDVKIHSAHKEGDRIDVSLETRQGSAIDATINLDKNVNIVFSGDISPYEPWALDWNFGYLTLPNRFSINGSFRDGVMHAKAKIPNIEFAYHMKADSLEVELDLNENGIVFTNGIIYTEKETFDFFGDVMWEDEHPHTSWDVTQRHGGHAYAYIAWTDSITIKMIADSVDVSTIPFAKIKLANEMNGEVTGMWHHNFTDNSGEVDIIADGNYQPFDFRARIRARENGDTIFIDKFHVMQDKNRVEAEAVFILPNDSNPDFKPTGILPIQVLHAWASAKDFSIPTLLEPLNDTTFSEGFMNGDVSYEQGKGLLGNIDFTKLSLSKIPTSVLKIDRMNLFAEGDRTELNAYVNIGNGGWAGSTQVIINNIFDNKRHVSFVHSTDNGGDVTLEGDVDSAFIFNGKLNVTGSWFIPGTTAEITKTDLQVDITSNIREGIKGITAEIKSDSTLLQPPKMGRKIPFSVTGHVENGIAEITELLTRNKDGETITASASYNIDSLKLEKFDIFSEQFSFKSGQHSIMVKEVSGSLNDYDNELVVSVSLPYIQYNFFDETFGEAEVHAQSDLDFSMPRLTGDRLRNNSISGKVIVDKMVYHKALEIQITPSSLNRILTMFNNFITRLRTTEAQEAKISTASPINLMVHVNDSQRDSTAIVTPFAAFPFTFDFWVLGNTNRPLLRGDIINSNNGFIGVQELYEFELNSFSISWMDVPWQQGVVEVSSTQELPYCDDSRDKENETCPINFDITGTITNPQPTPSSNCGTESSAAATYYNIILGCIADNNDESTDWNKLAGKAIGKVLSTTANKTLGGEYIGDIDMKVMLFSNNTTGDKDSSYFKIPISLDRWVKDLSLIFGYTQDQSENPTYDQALQFGVNYTLPVFKDKQFSHRNHLNPSLSLNGLLISKQYLTNTGAGGNESRLEKNIGFNYGYRFWNPCLLGIGHCETVSPNSSLKEVSDDKQETKKMKKLLAFLFILSAFVFAEETEKNPWYVKFEGNAVFSNFQLTEQLEIPDEFGNLDTIKQDFMMGLAVENIRALYYSQGFFSLDMKLEVKNEVDEQNKRKRAYAVFLREGERYRFGGTNIIVPDSSKIEINKKQLKTNNTDRIFSQDDIAEDIQFIQQTYRKAGYLHTYVMPSELIDTTRKVIIVEINVNPGAIVTMGNIRSTTLKVAEKGRKGQEAGLSDTAWLSSLWKTPKGEIIDGNQYISFKNKLLSTQLFTQIKLTDSLRADGLSDVHLDVVERIPGEARYGLFFEEMYGFGALAYAKHKNFFGTFNEFSTTFQLAQNKQEISLGYANPLLFGTSFSFIPTAIRFEDRLSFNHEKITPPAYPDSVEERYEIINRGDLTFGITDHIRFRGTLDTRFVSKNDNNMFKLKAEIALTFDYTDDYFNPTKGIRIAPTAGAGTNLTASLDNPSMIGNPYTYGEATVNLYHPLFWTFYGAVSGSVGKFFEKALEDDARVFYQGGSRSVRGYRFRSIYASYTSTDEEGNEVINTGLTPMYFRINEELRWAFPWKGWRHWQIVQFYDWTHVMDSEKDIYEAKTSEALGLGLRYRWQFLTFRLDYAFKKDLSNWGAEGFAWGRFAFDLSHTF